METMRQNSAEAKKAYANRCRELSVKYGLDFELCLTLGTDEERYKKFIEIVNFSVEHRNLGTEKAFENLQFYDIYCQQRCVKYIIGKRLFQELRLDKNNTNLQRVRAYLLQRVAWHITITITKYHWTYKLPSHP